MAKRKASRRKNKKNNSFMVFFIVVIVIAIISFVITYLVTQSSESLEDNKVEQIKEVKESNENLEVISPRLTLDGTWASYNDGAMMTISGSNYTIELPNVDATIVGKGKVVVVDNKITFVNTDEDSECNIKPGVYKFVLKGDEVSFEIIDDNCQSRSNRISATWFKV